MLGNSPENTPFHELHFLLRVLRRMSKGMMVSQSCSLQKICPPFWSPSVRLRLLLSKLWRLERRKVKRTGKASSFYFRYWLADLWGIRLSNTLTPAKWFPAKRLFSFTTYKYLHRSWPINFFFSGFLLSVRITWSKVTKKNLLSNDIWHLHSAILAAYIKAIEFCRCFCFAFWGTLKFIDIFFCLSLHILG